MARLGKFWVNNDSRVIYVFDDALVELRPSTISALPQWLPPFWIDFDAEGRSLDKREAALSFASDETSSLEIAQQFKWARRTAFADIERVELDHGTKTRTPKLTISTTDGKAANLFVKDEEAEYIHTLLARALGSKFQSDQGSTAST